MMDLGVSALDLCLWVVGYPAIKRVSAVMHRLDTEVEEAATLMMESVDGIVFTLEVSSAGLDRPLTRLADFERFTGFKAKAETRHLVDGRRRYSGIIAGVEGDQIVLRTEDGEPESNDEARLNFGDLAKAKLVATDELFELAKAGKLPRPVSAPAAAAEPVQTSDSDNPNDPTTGQDPES